MTPSLNPIILIPARMGSTRLPGKPLAEIGGLPMIVRVWQQAMKAGLGPVIVAAGEAEIVAAVAAHGGQSILTEPDLASGSDRIHAALQQLDPESRHQVVINLQGDLPALAPDMLHKVLAVLGDGDLATLAARITDPADHSNPHVVKPVIAWDDASQSAGRALYFTRAAAPHGDGERFHHVGIYAYRRAALSRFVSLPPSALEQREKLEQLRALEAGMTIRIGRVDTVPLSVDTPADLAKARALLETQ